MAAGYIQHLFLVRNSLISIEHKEFAMSIVPTLETFNVAYNMITHISDVFYESAKMLKTLNLSHNRLLTVSPKLGLVKSLSSLYLHSNRFEKIPVTLALLNLKELSLGWLKYSNYPQPDLLRDEPLQKFKNFMKHHENEELELGYFLNNSDMMKMPPNAYVKGDCPFFKSVLREDQAVTKYILDMYPNWISRPNDSGITAVGLSVKHNLLRSLDILLPRDTNFDMCMLCYSLLRSTRKRKLSALCYTECKPEDVHTLI
jgi:Leucine-rich repeat (LRR) protein